MDRVTAMRPLAAGEGRFTVTAGVLIRSGIRKACLVAGLDYYEDRSFLESVFVVRGPASRVIPLKAALEEHFG